MKTSPSHYKSLSPSDLGLGTAIAIVVTAIWFMGSFHSRHDSDSLIHSLNSLYQWTPFVWEYDHVGSLLSLLTRFITRPYWNVLAISTLSSLLFLTGLALWGCLIAPISFTESSLWVALLVPIMLTQKAIFVIASHTVTSGTALFFSGLYVYAVQRYLHARQNRKLVPLLFVLAFLATYLSKIAFIPMTAVTIGLLWVHRPLSWRKIIAVSLCLGLALLCYQLLEQASPFKKDYTLYLASLPIALPRLLDSWGSKYMTGLVWLAAPALMLLYRPTRHNPVFLSFSTGVAIQTLIISCSRWAAINSYDGHFLYDLSFLTLLAVIGLAVSLSRQWLPTHLQRGALIALAVGAFGLNVYMWDTFHPANPLTRMEKTLGTNTPDLVAAECDLIVDDYWTAWPPMLALNDYYYRNNIFDPESHSPRKVYSITYLAASIEHLWRPILEQPDVRLCSLAGDDPRSHFRFEHYLSTYTPEIALQTVPVAKIGGVIVYEVNATPLHSVSLDFDQLVPGEGWGLDETSPNGVTFRWMKGTEATIILPLATDRNVLIEFRVLYAMSTDILNSMTLHVNDKLIPLNSTSYPEGGTVFQGVIPQSALAANGRSTILTFHVNDTLIPELVMPPSDDPRSLGLALDWLHIK